MLGGPLITAYFTDYLFKNPLLVGNSLCLTVAVFGCMASMCFFVEQKGMRHAIASREVDNFH